jgi:hypothetical protein
MNSLIDTASSLQFRFPGGQITHVCHASAEGVAARAALRWTISRLCQSGVLQGAASRNDEERTP